MRTAKGVTRSVLLIRGYALKFPRCSSFKSFVQGLLANMDESLWKNSPDDWNLCPLVYSNRYGLLNIMVRCRPVRHRGLFRVEAARLIALTPLSKEWFASDLKPNNFGYLGSKLVKLDYAN